MTRADRARESRPEVAGAPGCLERATALSGFERVSYGDTSERVVPERVEELSDLVRWAEAERRPIVPAGAGTRAFLGRPPPTDALVVSMERFATIEEYEPGDFTIGVAAGLRLDALKEALALNGQEIAFHIAPGEGGTIGGLIATGWPDPRIARIGPLRSAVIGAHGLRGGGRPFKTGGRVVKNVAGYDVAKLLVGSLGAAGILLRANLKLRPRPADRRIGRAIVGRASEAFDIAARLRRERFDPHALFVLNGAASRHLWSGVMPQGSFAPIPEDERCEVLWLVEGNPALVRFIDEGARSLARESLELESRERDVAEDALDRLVAIDRPLGTDDSALILRLSVLPSDIAKLTSEIESMARSLGFAEPAIACDVASGQIVLRIEDVADRAAAAVSSLERALGDIGGSGWLVWAPPESRRPLPFLLGGGLADASARKERLLAERILSVFDPHGIFSPGRLWARSSPSHGDGARSIEP